MDRISFREATHITKLSALLSNLESESAQLALRCDFDGDDRSLQKYGRRDCNDSASVDLYVQIAVAFATSRTLLSLSLHSVDAMGCLVLARSLKLNVTLQYFSLKASNTELDNQMGLAMAEAVKGNVTLRSFSLDASVTRIDNQTGLAMAEAVKANVTLQSFSLHASDTQIDDQTGLEMARLSRGQWSATRFCANNIVPLRKWPACARTSVFLASLRGPSARVFFRIFSLRRAIGHPSTMPKTVVYNALRTRRISMPSVGLST
jgi:hypothetical protein